MADISCAKVREKNDVFFFFFGGGVLGLGL